MVAQILDNQKLADKSLLNNIVTITPRETIEMALNGFIRSGFRKKIT